MNRPAHVIQIVLYRFNGLYEQRPATLIRIMGDETRGQCAQAWQAVKEKGRGKKGRNTGGWWVVIPICGCTGFSYGA